MVTIKSFTSLEQSKKLAEFLPLESADMYYTLEDFVNEDTGDIISTEKVSLGHPSNKEIGCWTLAALLGVIPEPDLVQNSEGTWLIHSWVNAYPWSVGGYSNTVDACYELILKLHELKML